MDNKTHPLEVIRLVWSNRAKDPVRVRLKHMTGSCELAQGMSCEVRARGPATGAITVDQIGSEIILDGWCCRATWMMGIATC